jgi:hypothetical protein
LEYSFIKRLFSKYFNFIIFFVIGCVVILLLLFVYKERIKPEVRNYYIDAEVIKFENNVLTVKGMKFNPEFARGTYKIKITDKVLVSDWETNNTLEQKALNDNKYVTVVFTGQEKKIKDNGYLKGVNQIYCNVEERGFTQN